MATIEIVSKLLESSTDSHIPYDNGSDLCHVVERRDEAIIAKLLDSNTLQQGDGMLIFVQAHCTSDPGIAEVFLSKGVYPNTVIFDLEANKDTCALFEVVSVSAMESFYNMYGMRFTTPQGAMGTNDIFPARL